MDVGQQLRSPGEVGERLLLAEDVVGVCQQAHAGEAQRAQQAGRLLHRVEQVRLRPAQRLHRQGDVRLAAERAAPCEEGAEGFLPRLAGDALRDAPGSPAAEDDHPDPELRRPVQDARHVPAQGLRLLRGEKRELPRQKTVRRLHGQAAGAHLPAEGGKFLLAHRPQRGGGDLRVVKAHPQQPLRARSVAGPARQAAAVSHGNPSLIPVFYRFSRPL